MATSMALPKNQARLLRALYDLRFRSKCRPFPEAEEAPPRCPPSVPLYLLLAEFQGMDIDVEATIEMLCSRGLAAKAKRPCAPSGTWTFPDGRIFAVSVQSRRDEHGGWHYQGMAFLNGEPFDLGDLYGACFDLSREGIETVERLAASPPPAWLAPLPLDPGSRDAETLPAKWGGDWVSHSKAARIMGYTSRQTSNTASGDALRKAIQAAPEGDPLAILKDKTERCAKDSKSGRLRRDAVEYVARARQKYTDAPARTPSRHKHAQNAESCDASAP